MSGDPEGVDLTQLPTIKVDHTREGLIVGTPACMSPEQARGLAVDKRTDIWAFGCVLYEMLTRRAAFQRDTVTDTLAAVVQSEADWSRLPANIPTGVRRLLGRCLEKDPKRRRDIGDARVDLDPEADDVRPGLAGAGTTTSQSLPPARAGALMPQTWVDRDRRRGHPPPDSGSRHCGCFRGSALLPGKILCVCR